MLSKVMITNAIDTSCTALMHRVSCCAPPIGSRLVGIRGRIGSKMLARGGVIM